MNFFKRSKQNFAKSEIQTKETDNENALFLSAVVLGPKKVGKTTFSKNFAKSHDMLFVNISEAAFCDSNLDSLKNLFQYYKTQAFELKFCENRSSVEKRFEAYAQLAFQNLLFRQAFPTVKNFAQMGFSSAVHKELQTLDPMCAQIYFKNFENQLVESIVSNLNIPCILDMPASMSLQQDKNFAICVHTSIEKYKNSPQNYPIIQEYLKINNLSVEDLIKMPTKNFEEMSQILNKVGTIVALQYPQNSNNKIKNDCSADLANGKTICSNLTKTTTKQVVCRYSKKSSITFFETYEDIDANNLREMISAMEVFMSDKNTNIFSTKKETVLSF